MQEIKKLPALPQIAYCKLNRASRLLESDIEDLLHWGAIGAIDLCCCLDGFVVDFITFVDKSSEDFIAWVPDCKFINLTPFANISLSSWDIKPPFDGTLNGYWSLTYDSLRKIENHGKISINDVWVYSMSTDGIYAQSKLERKLRDEDLFITLDDLWITYPNLEKIHNVLTKGTMLSHIYNDVNLAQKIQNHTQPPQIRVTAKQSQMIKALIQVHPDLKDLINTPHSLFNKLELLLGSRGILCPALDSNTIADWLKKAERI
nr:hypothetical protein [uncultured Tolumonas sp.]